MSIAQQSIRPSLHNPTILLSVCLLIEVFDQFHTWNHAPDPPRWQAHRLRKTGTTNPTTYVNLPGAGSQRDLTFRIALRAHQFVRVQNLPPCRFRGNKTGDCYFKVETYICYQLFIKLRMKREWDDWAIIRWISWATSLKPDSVLTIICPCA